MRAKVRRTLLLPQVANNRTKHDRTVSLLSGTTRGAVTSHLLPLHVVACCYKSLRSRCRFNRALRLYSGAVSERPVIVWFRQDLRLADNPAVTAAAASGAPLLPVFILDDENAGAWAQGAASRWWLHQSLDALDRALGGALRFLRGKADELLPELAVSSGAQSVYWNRCYEPWRIERDKVVKGQLQADGFTVRTFNASLLFEPPAVTRKDGTPYRVFTPFYRNGCLDGAVSPRALCKCPADLTLCRNGHETTLQKLDLMPRIHWYEEIAGTWTPGETGATERLQAFLSRNLDNYKGGRNRPDLDAVSRLSPHLHFGEISPHQLWHAIDGSENEDAASFLSELGWREFSYYLLYHWPELPRDNLQRKFNRFPWRDDANDLSAWQQGRTGYPFVDAGMRELWCTGYMHNRVRMVAGSFLVKNLMLHWHHGEDWFWDTLVDADLANNSASWQWVAGTGADAAPYFRIFNPVTQGRKFDPDGGYVRRYVPEIGALPDRYLHEPWSAPREVLQKAGVTLGSNYPHPVVDLKASRERALAAFRSLSPEP